MKIFFDASNIDSFSAAWVFHRKHPDADVVSTPPAVPPDVNDIDCTKLDGMGAYTLLHPGYTIPWPVAYVADRPARILAYTDEINTAIDSWPRTVVAWDMLADIADPTTFAYGRLPPPVVMEGRAILRWKANQPAVAPAHA